MKSLFAAAVVSLVLGSPALAQTNTTAPIGSPVPNASSDLNRFPQDAIQNGRRRQATRAEIEQRAGAPGSPLAGKPLLETSKDADKQTDRLFEESLKNSKGVTPDDPSARPPVGSR
ncbi:hypothetical protein [Roseiterribacter gracilis]|uniref:Serine/threonine protein kinase n=1 Tax=Roseiterribacter gracilis TaxID=2812848 RepID=A0A8S8XHS8_9PROT|nr:hypothetical protein TMPK1_30120 [Rhodospirillales bacterium TMPK1]